MKPKSTLGNFLALAGSSLLAITYTHAATLYWDGNNVDGGNPLANANGGAGAWNNALTNWDTLAAGGLDSAWTAGDTAVFTMASATPATVTLADDITVGGLTFNGRNTFNNGTYTLDVNGNTLSFASGDNTILFNPSNGVPNAIITGQVAGTGANLIVRVANPVYASTLTFNGASTGGWTGTTTIGAGRTLTTTSTVAATNKVLNDTSGITLNSGTIQFTRDGNTALGAITENAIGVNGSSTFSVTSTNGGASAIENIGTVTVNSGQMNFVQTANNANQLVLGGLSRGASTTSAVTFSSNGLFANAKFVVTGAGGLTASNEIFAPWATTGTTAALQTDYAVFNASNEVGARGITASAQSTWSTAHAATSNYTLTNAAAGSAANGSLDATRVINTVRNSTATVAIPIISSNTITLAGSSYQNGDAVALGVASTGTVLNTVYYVVGASGTSFQLAATPGGTPLAISGATATIAGGITLSTGNNLQTYGILNGSTAPLAIGASGTGAVTTPIGGGNLFLNTGSGSILINAPITDNGAVTVVKNGSAGVLALSGNNTFTGGLVVNAGTLRLSGTQGFTGGVTLNGGSFGDAGAGNGITAAALNGNSVTVNGLANMFITSGATINGAVAINSTGNLVLNGDAATFNGVVSGSGLLAIFSRSSTTVTLANTANTHTGAIAIYGDNNQPNTLAVNSLADSASQGAGNIQLGTAANGSGSFALHSGAIAPLILNNRQFDIQGDNNNITKISNNSSQAFTINSNLLASATGIKTLTLGGGALGGLSTFAGTITNGNLTTLGLTKADANNTWALTNAANSYNGATTITAGTLIVSSLADGGSNSSIGASSNAAGNLILNGGTLRYTGAAVSTDRLFSLQTFSTIDASGTGAVNFTNTGAMGFNSGVAAKTLTLTGTNTGNNTIAASIANNTGTTGITKTGAGTWVLSNTNTYTGATSVNGGRLQLQSGASNLTQTLGALALSGGDVTLESNKSGAGSITTNFNAFTARLAGNTGNIVSTGGTNGTDNTVNITGAAGFIDKGIYFNGADFAYRNALNTYVRAPIYGTDSTFVTTATASNHVKLSSSYSGAGLTLLSLNLAGSAVGWTNTTGNLTVPGIIKSGGGSQSTISGGNLGTTGNAELLIRTDTSSDLLAISSNLTQGGGFLVKSGAGTLTLSGTASTYTGQTYVNGGTLSIGANINIGAQATGAQLNLRGGTLQATGTFGLFNGTAGINNRAVVLTDSAGFDVTSTHTLTVAGVVSGTGSLTKTNTGTLTLTNTNTYAGATTVTDGTLLVNGNISTSILTTVQTGATLGGSGSVGALTINSGGIFSPGNSPGITTVNGNYIQNGTLQAEIEGLTAGNGTGNHDQVVVNGTVTLNGLLSLTTFTGTYAVNNLLFILLNDGSDAITGTFTGLAQGASVGTYAGFDWQISYTGDSTGTAFTGGNDVVLRAVAAIPEPGAALLGGLGMLMLLRRRRG